MFVFLSTDFIASYKAILYCRISCLWHDSWPAPKKKPANTLREYMMYSLVFINYHLFFCACTACTFALNWRQFFNTCHFIYYNKNCNCTTALGRLIFCYNIVVIFFPLVSELASHCICVFICNFFLSQIICLLSFGSQRDIYRNWAAIKLLCVERWVLWYDKVVRFIIFTSKVLHLSLLNLSI